MVWLYLTLACLTLIGDALLLAVLFAFLFRRKLKGLFMFLSKHALLFAFIIAVIATLGSLYFSEILGLEPCKLCWFQRIFMYPLVPLLGIAALKRDRAIWRYAVPLGFAGSSFSLYHYYIQWFPAASACTVTGISCAEASFAYGYISIPLMALTAFLIILGLAALSRKPPRGKQQPF